MACLDSDSCHTAGDEQLFATASTTLWRQAEPFDARKRLSSMRLRSVLPFSKRSQAGFWDGGLKHLG